MNRPEQDLQRAIVQWLDLLANQGKLTFFHPANGGYRTTHEAKIFKSLGVKSGVADLIIMMGGRAIAVELKADKGRLTASQSAWGANWQAQGGEWFLVKSLGDMEGVLGS